MKPKVLRATDLLWLAAALVVTILIVIVHVNGRNNIALWQSIGMGGMVFFAWTFWPAVLLQRWRFVRSISFVTDQGLLVIGGDFIVPRREIDDVTVDTLLAWTPALLSSKCIAPTVSGTYVVFRPLPFRVPRYRGLFSGFAVPSAKTIYVGWRSPLSSTALAHELGHQILANAGLPPSESMLHEFHLQYGTPY